MTASSERIEKLRARYQQETPVISVERARYYTQSWQKTEGQNLSGGERVALAMKHVYENMTHHVSADDRLAGYWTEDFLGIPVDIERGVFNTVLETELDQLTLLASRARGLGRTAAWLVKEGQAGPLVSNSVKKARRGLFQPPAGGGEAPLRGENLRFFKAPVFGSGHPWPQAPVGQSFQNFANRRSHVTGAKNPAARGAGLDLNLDTMTRRRINRFAISPHDKHELLRHLLPWWKGKTMVDRLERELAASGLVSRDMLRFSTALPANTSRQTLMISPCATIGAYQGHVILDFETVLKKGLLAMHADVTRQLASEELTGNERAFLRSAQLALEGVMVYARRLAEALQQAHARETDPARRASLKAMLANCRVAPLHPARTFTQAVQGAWTVKTAVELAHPVNLHSFGRMDQIFHPFYARDLKAGRISRDEARELLEELLLKVMSQNIRPESGFLSEFYHRYLGSSPITLGGVKPNGEDATNDLTFLFLEAAARSRAVTNVSLRLHGGSPQALWLAAAQALYEGGSNLSLYNDDVNVTAMQRRGFSLRDARDYAVMGCVEMLCPGKTGGMSANALLLNRLLDITLRGGSAATLLATIPQAGLALGGPDRFTSFDDLLQAFQAQAAHQMDLLAAASNLRDELYAQHLPAPLISVFIKDCVKNKKDVTAGGACYDLSGISFINSIANTVDSLMAIKTLVFDQKEITLAQLLKAIDANFAGHEALRQRLLSLPGKWGNGHEETDQLARQITSGLFQRTYDYQAWRGGAFVPYLISMTTHTIDGRFSIASADGRLAATPYAASCNPYNVEKNGVTSALRSVATLDFRDVLGAAVNLKFHPSALGATAPTRQKWASLIATYFALGGAQLQPTVASAQTLLAAQKNPENYRDLIVKVGGYSAYFTELGREIQNEIIARTGHEATAAS